VCDAISGMVTILLNRRVDAEPRLRGSSPKTAFVSPRADETIDVKLRG
jgi:hypothetical protein